MKKNQRLCISCALLSGLFFMISSNAYSQTKTGNGFIGASVIAEDGVKTYPTFGVNAAYTHPLSRALGITGDAGGWIGSVSGTKYFHGELMGGLSFFVPHTGKNAFTPYLLVGASYMHSSYSYGGMNFTGSGTNLTAAVGASYSFPVSHNLNLALKADYNPAFGKGIIDNNIRVGVGIDIGDHPHTVSKPKYGGTLGADTTRERPKTPKTDSTSSSGTSSAYNPEDHNQYHTQFGEPCEASSVTGETKVSFALFSKVTKELADIISKVPRVECKISLKANATAKTGEECCAKTEKPINYLELKASLDVTAEVNVTLLGLPDIKLSVHLWPALLVINVQAKVFAGPKSTMNVEVIGKLYGALEHPIYRDNCPGCIYASLKDETFGRVGIKAAAEAEVFFWAPENAGYDFEEVDEDGKPVKPIKVGISAEATIGVGLGFSGTWAGYGKCTKPPPGFHGKFFFGKAKANLKFSLNLGIVSFEPSIEIPISDGWEFKIDY